MRRVQEERLAKLSETANAAFCECGGQWVADDERVNLFTDRRRPQGLTILIGGKVDGCGLEVRVGEDDRRKRALAAYLAQCEPGLMRSILERLQRLEQREDAGKHALPDLLAILKAHQSELEHLRTRDVVKWTSLPVKPLLTVGEHANGDVTFVTFNGEEYRRTVPLTLSEQSGILSYLLAKQTNVGIGAISDEKAAQLSAVLDAMPAAPFVISEPPQPVWGAFENGRRSELNEFGIAYMLYVEVEDQGCTPFLEISNESLPEHMGSTWSLDIEQVRFLHEQSGKLLAMHEAALNRVPANGAATFGGDA